MLVIGVTLMEMSKPIMVVGVEKILIVDWQMLMKEMQMQNGIMTKNVIDIWNFH